MAGDKKNNQRPFTKVISFLNQIDDLIPGEPEEKSAQKQNSANISKKQLHGIDHVTGLPYDTVENNGKLHLNFDINSKANSEKLSNAIAFSRFYKKPLDEECSELIADKKNREQKILDLRKRFMKPVLCNTPHHTYWQEQYYNKISKEIDELESPSSQHHIKMK